MNSVGSHGNLSLPFVMKVMVCHFVSDSHEVMTALIVVLPLIVVVEISLQLHRSYEMIDQSRELGFWSRSSILVKGGWWYCSFYKMHIVLGVWKLAFFVQNQLCGSWCNEGCYGPNVSRNGNNEVCVGETLWYGLQLPQGPKSIR